MSPYGTKATTTACYYSRILYKYLSIKSCVLYQATHKMTNKWQHFYWYNLDIIYNILERYCCNYGSIHYENPHNFEFSAFSRYSSGGEKNHNKQTIDKYWISHIFHYISIESVNTLKPTVCWELEYQNVRRTHIRNT